MAKLILLGQDSPAMNETITTHMNDSTKHMTEVDRTKLNGITEGATKTVITNNLTTTTPGSALDAVQGKFLKEQIDQANSKFTNDLHKYFMGGLVLEPAFAPYE